jgi:hypothetical protein
MKNKWVWILAGAVVLYFLLIQSGSTGGNVGASTQGSTGD